MAGSVCPEPLMRRVMEQMCMSEITICYGLTEGSPVMTQTRTDDTVERRVRPWAEYARHRSHHPRS